MNVCILSDIHLQSDNSSEVAPALENLVQKINQEIQPDFLVVLGDLIEHSDSAEEDIRHIRTVKHTLDGVQSEVVYLIGNHDIMNVEKATIREILDQDLWGRIHNENMIYLDSSAPSLLDARGDISEQQLEFLDSELKRMNECILFVHHPLYYHNIEDNDWFGESPELAFCGNKDEVNKILTKHDNVTAVFNGHLHEVDYTRVEDTHHFTVNAFAKEYPGSGVTGTFTELHLNNEMRVRIVEGDRMVRSFEIPSTT